MIVKKRGNSPSTLVCDTLYFVSRCLNSRSTKSHRLLIFLTTVFVYGVLLPLGVVEDPLDTGPTEDGLRDDGPEVCVLTVSVTEGVLDSPGTVVTVGVVTTTGGESSVSV